MRKRNPNATADDAKAAFGKSYREMIAEVKTTLKNLDRHFPQYKGQGYEIAGLIWFQGWNDMINPTYTAAYADNLVHFIQDVRRDLDAPKMPVVIGQMGVGGVNVKGGKDEFKAAEAAAAGRAANTVLVKTDVFWDAEAAAVFEKGWRKHLDEWNKVGSDYPYHYLGSAKTYCRIGGAFARAAVELDQWRAKSK
jgi:alpha-galactosidase